MRVTREINSWAGPRTACPGEPVKKSDPDPRECHLRVSDPTLRWSKIVFPEQVLGKIHRLGGPGPIRQLNTHASGQRPNLPSECTAPASENERRLSGGGGVFADHIPTRAPLPHGRDSEGGAHRSLRARLEKRHKSGRRPDLRNCHELPVCVECRPPGSTERPAPQGRVCSRHAV